jgi:hypothetical protein
VDAKPYKESFANGLVLMVATRQANWGGWDDGCLALVHCNDPEVILPIKADDPIFSIENERDFWDYAVNINKEPHAIWSDRDLFVVDIEKWVFSNFKDGPYFNRVDNFIKYCRKAGYRRRAGGASFSWWFVNRLKKCIQGGLYEEVDDIDSSIDANVVQ